MKQSFIKNGVVRSYDVRNNRVIGACIEQGRFKTYNPTIDAFHADGWQDYIEPVPEPPSKEEQYRNRVVQLIRIEYSVDDELARLRQRETKSKEYDEYFAYCEACKKQAYEEIYGKEAPADLALKQEDK